MSVLSRRGLNSLVKVTASRYCSTSRKGLKILGIETSCDDTGVAILNTEGVILGESLYSQQKFHLRYGGVTPPRAQDLHRQNIEKAVSECFQSAGLDYKDIDAIAVTNRPGLALSLLVGVRYAKYLARTYSKPLIPIHHMEAHALAARMDHKIPYPFLCLLISGGHCQLTFVKSATDFFLLGESLDDAPGEAFDKTARRLKLRNLPQFEWLSGGASIEKASKEAENVDRFPFPLPLARTKDCQFSFAGLKHAALRHIKNEEQIYELGPDEIIPHYTDFCAGFLKAITRHISYRTQRAIEYCQREKLFEGVNDLSLVISGGVACNDFIFDSITKMASHYKYKTFRPAKKYCNDNGVMIAWNGIEKINNNGECLKYDLNSVDIIGKCSLGKSWIEDVRNAEIQCKWIQVKWKENLTIKT